MSTEHPHSHLSAVVYSSSSDDAGGRQSESSAQWHEWQQAFCQDAGMRTVCAAAVLLFSVSTLFFSAQHRRNGRCECFWIFGKSTWKFITISYCVHVATRKKAWKRVENFSDFPLQWVEFKKCTHDCILGLVHVFVGGLWGTIHCVKHRQSPQHPRKSVGESNFVCNGKYYNSGERTHSTQQQWT